MFSSILHRLNCCRFGACCLKLPSHYFSIKFHFTVSASCSQITTVVFWTACLFSVCWINIGFERGSLKEGYQAEIKLSAIHKITLIFMVRHPLQTAPSTKNS